MSPSVRRIGFPYAGDRFGGSNVSSLTLAVALREAGLDPVVLTHGPGRAADEAVARELPVVLLPPLSEQSGYSQRDRARLEQLGALRAAFSAIRQHRLDLVHVNDLGMLRTWAAPALIARRPLIAHWRTALEPSRSVALALRSAAAIIAISERSRSVLPGWAQGRTTVEYNPMAGRPGSEDRDAAKARIRSLLGLPANAALIGIFGTLIRRKRTHVIADVVRAITRTADGCPVFGIVCGEPAEPLDELLAQKIADYGLGERIRLVGFVKPVEPWMAACDVVLAPAVDEAFGRTSFEALASGTPVVVSNDSGSIEILGTGAGALFLPPEPIGAWVDAVAELLTDRERTRRMVEAGALAVGELSPTRHAERIQRIYEDVRPGATGPGRAGFAGARSEPA